MKLNLLETKQDVQSLVPNYIPVENISTNTGGGWLIVFGEDPAIIIAVDCGEYAQYIWSVKGKPFSDSCKGERAFMKSWDEYWESYG